MGDPPKHRGSYVDKRIQTRGEKTLGLLFRVCMLFLPLVVHRCETIQQIRQTVVSLYEWLIPGASRVPKYDFFSPPTIRGCVGLQSYCAPNRTSKNIDFWGIYSPRICARRLSCPRPKRARIIFRFRPPSKSCVDLDTQYIYIYTEHIYAVFRNSDIHCSDVLRTIPARIDEIEVSTSWEIISTSYIK